MASSDTLAAVFAHIEANRSAFLDRLLAYLRHPSISAENIGIAEVGALLVEMLTTIGLETNLVPTDGHPMVVARWQKAPGKPTVLLYGHYDVQPPDPLDKWLSPPFEPTIRDGRIYARGVGDNKGQHFAQILAIESHLAVHGTLPCNVILLLEGEEEIGSPNIAGFVQANKAMLAADLAVTADGPRHASGAAAIKFGSRGVVSFELRCRHASRDVHSGNFGGVVPNPIWTLVHLLGTMKNAAGEITIAGLHDDIEAPTNEELAAIEALPLDVDAVKHSLGLSRLDAPADRAFYERLCFRPTLTINGFHGGYGGPGSKTVLPNEAFVKCDIRLVEAQDPQDILRKVAAHVAEHAPEVEFIAADAGMQPSKTPIASSFTAPLRRAFVAAQGIEPLLIPAGFGSLPGYVFTKILGIPAFVTPYANPDEANHAPNENLTLDCFYSGLRTGAALLHELGQLEEP
ncbi:Acetylornithine deacetylase/succinyl-diaminopimelate desuccinylase-like protein [Bosea sp. 62]|uniref:M20/M25/M40 family metallo-hydrolase n=1 Tax=unclassified Bosea (in: a-proteobacteria) TaxID=2653178 RepID=UPI00125541E1|nr:MULTISPECIES: M20/M25/M40 family metallo-hydrolase [unclassified Bosea (in: a-proteobacteria)]CAD5264780.1 Acetylornithine deacetylase/succinyl-diaminopimelate desuccinylase-like protein [Bosea sp. 46]CAD5267090.1 Acetylornithine deacetylase/succinyl-diaminopimelate desuccinylase-like protein [Bosea sp. 21B]CAD5272132.1 Acetylornithine deacetylase/succinyl-diaminopimelate desuccinylase-like protein [Bosea sp. 7B]VVT55966.1 Peptidase M20 [Bosea sp. EC-HK365B]VXB83739.1 Acetylornithine deacet